MQQKYKVLSFAIVAALYIFLVPSTSQANFKTTHTPGETVGPRARPAIKHQYPRHNSKKGCEDLLIEAEQRERDKRGYTSGQRRVRYNVFSVGLGSYIRYIQSTGGYCYYYNGGTTHVNRYDDQVIQMANR
jgi:hypothetical protein